MNALDAVIGLPANIFYGTSIPSCILVFKKCRENDAVLFIDASREYTKQANQNVLTDTEITKITNTYKNRQDIDRYARAVSLAEIRENEYNLNIPRYIDTFEPEAEIDIKAVSVECKALDIQMNEIDRQILKYCKELNIDTPF